MSGKQIRATRVDDINGSAGQEPGTFELRYYHHQPDMIGGMAFRCPCGCGRAGYLPLNGEGHPGPSWGWDGNTEAPTLLPSIYAVGFPCKWHGWLNKGVWQTC